MPDESLDILVKTTGDPSGADKVAASLDKTKAGAKNAAQALQDELDPATAHLSETQGKTARSAENLGLSHHELHKVAHLAGEAFGDLGRILASAAMGPFMLVITVLGVLMGAFAKLHAAMTLVVGKATVSLLTSLAGIQDRTIAAAAGTDTFVRSIRELQSIEGILARQWSSREAALHDETKAAEEAAEATKKLTEAKLKLALESGKITPEQYEAKMADVAAQDDKTRIENARKARQAEIDLKKQEQDDARTLSGRKAQEAAELQPAARDAAERVARGSEEIGGLRKQLDAWEKEQIDMKETNPKRHSLKWLKLNRTIDNQKTDIAETVEKQAAAEMENARIADQLKKAQEAALALKGKAEEAKGQWTLAVEHDSRMRIMENDNFASSAKLRDVTAGLNPESAGAVQIHHDQSTAQALLAGQGVQAAAREQMVAHAQMLTGVAQSIGSAARVMAHVGDELDQFKARVLALEAKLSNTHN